MKDQRINNKDRIVELEKRVSVLENRVAYLERSPVMQPISLPHDLRWPKLWASPHSVS